MSLTGSGPDDPQRVGVPIARPAVRDVRRLRRARRAARAARAPATGTVVRTSLLAAVVGVHAFQGTRWTVAGEVGRAQGNHHPSIAPYGLFHCRDGAVQIARRQRGPVEAVLRRLRARPATPTGWRPTSERVAARERVIEVVEAAFADWDAEPLLARLAEVGVPAGKVRTPRRGLRVGPDRAARACSSTSSTRRSGGSRCPGPPLRFFDAAGDEVTRTRPRGPAAARPARRRDPRLGRRRS